MKQELVLELTDDIVGSLKTKCDTVGTNLTEVCKRAGVHRTTLEYWKKKTPNTFLILVGLLKAIDDIASEKVNHQGNLAGQEKSLVDQATE